MSDTWCEMNAQTPLSLCQITTDDDLFELCRQQAKAMQITYGTIDRYTGFTDQFWSKKLATSKHSLKPGKRPSKRGWSSEAFQASMAGFCFKLVAVHDPEAEAKLREFMERKLEQSARPQSMLLAGTRQSVKIELSMRQLKKLAKRGGLARAGKLTKRQRVRIAKLAGRASRAKLTKEQRIESARNASNARWKRQRCVASTSELADAKLA